MQGVDGTADAHNWGVDHHSDGHDHEHLHLNHVVCSTGNQRRRRELVELRIGEVFHLAENPFTQVSSQPGTDSGSQKSYYDGAGCC